MERITKFAFSFTFTCRPLQMVFPFASPPSPSLSDSLPLGFQISSLMSLSREPSPNFRQGGGLSWACPLMTLITV